MGQHIVSEMKISGPNMPPFFGVHKFADFRANWNKFTSNSLKALRPVMFPTMIYARTFRFSERALRHFGIDTVLNDLTPGKPIDGEIFMKTMLKLSMKNTGLLIFAARSFDGDWRNLGWTFVIDCLPLLKCTHCGMMENDNVEAKVCSGCQSTFYCSRKCQKNDWQNHKKVCKEKDGTDHNPL